MLVKSEGVKKRLLSFLQDRANVIFKTCNSGLMSGICKIDRGWIHIDPSLDWDDVVQVSLLLHEIGHYFSVPVMYRDKLTKSLKGVPKEYICEYSARLVSISIAERLNIPDEYLLGVWSVYPNHPDRGHTKKSFELTARIWAENAKINKGKITLWA
jgi:hypothetical protein